MARTKCCPKCDSLDASPDVLYKSSIRRCLDCGYKEAFIVEDCGSAEQTHGLSGTRLDVVT